MQKVGDSYATKGKDELAIYYYAGAYRLDVEDKEARTRLETAVKTAARKLKMKYDASAEAKRYREALGLATRREAVYLYAQRAGLAGFAPEAAGQDAQKVSRLAAKAALAQLDAAADGKVTETAKLRLAREALALDPDDPDLATRYEDMRKRLERKVAVRIQGPAAAREEAERLVGRLLGVLTGATRELFVVVPLELDQHDVLVDVVVAASVADSGWRQTGAGQAVGMVDVLNRFNERVLNSKGKPKQQKVHARWRTMSRKSSANVSVQATINDLRAKKTLYDRRLTATPSSVKKFYSWQGDERALNSLLLVAVRGHGVDQSPPEPGWALVTGALPGLAAGHAKALLDKLEYR